MSRLAQSACFAAMFLVAACARPPVEPPDTRAADEATIRTQVGQWSAAAQAKDPEKSASFFAPDAVLLLERAPDLHGVATLREGFGHMMEDPNFALSFTPDNVVAARSGDLTYETGSYAITMTGPGGRPGTEKGHYVFVWQKQADGSWKVVVDAPVSD
jgi:uncharacterized protein (TIGR02246 family)